MLWPLWPRVQTLSALWLPCVCLASAMAVSHMSALVFALSPLRPHLQTLFAMCPPCVGHVFAIWLRLQALSAMCPPSLLSTMRPLKPWPCLWTLSALGLLWGRAMASSNNFSFAPLRNPQRLYCMPAGQFPSYIHFGSPNSAFATAPYKYAWKSVWGLRWYIPFQAQINIQSYTELQRQGGAPLSSAFDFSGRVQCTRMRGVRHPSGFWMRQRLWRHLTDFYLM